MLWDLPPWWRLVLSDYHQDTRDFLTALRIYFYFINILFSLSHVFIVSLCSVFLCIYYDMGRAA